MSPKRNAHILIRCGLLLSSFVILGSSFADSFRTDGGDEKLPWFQLKPGEFPPDGSAHSIAGELIALDHINRTIGTSLFLSPCSRSAR
jgi:hypothetical protein